MEIVVEVNRSLGFVERETYNLLDFFSDVGGTQTVLFSLSMIYLSLVNYEHFDSYIASKLFKIKMSQKEIANK